jgi:hypothetical protein
VKRKNIAAAVACATVPLLFAATPARSDTTTAPAHAATVERGSAEVMPFDLNRTMHIFKPTSNGGLQTVIVHDGDPQQVALVRAHLRKEASAFARGDFADPAKIHGTKMPGLAQLRAGTTRITVGYAQVPNGASIRYKTSDPHLVAALHDWFAAQVQDHGAHAMMMGPS